jgi:type IV pilus assembly protein PilE
MTTTALPARRIARQTSCRQPASKNGWYTLTIPNATAIAFTVRATATAGQSQFQDTECRSFSVTDRGVRTALDAGGADNTAECWR